MNKVVYGGIALAGLVFALLDYLIADRTQVAFTVILATAFILGLIYLFTEFRFYRRHNALLASFQFLAIPTGLLLLGTIIGPKTIGPTWITVNISILNGIRIQSTIVSIILIIPVFMLLQLYARYYDGRYPGFVIRRKQYGAKKIPITINTITLVLIVILGYLIDIIDFMGIVFFFATITLWIVKFVTPYISSQRQSSISSSNRREYLNSLTRNSTRHRRSASRSSSRPSARTDSSTSRRRSRDIPTSPSSGYREVPVRSRNAPRRTNSSSSSQSSSSNRSSRSSNPTPSRVASVEPGIEPVTPTRTRKVKSSKISDYLPKGNYDHTDLKCMVCYEDFSQSSKGNIIICPSCKFPAHEVELKSWLNTSERCPRCNKEIRRHRKLNSGIVSEAQYAKFIKKL